MLGEGMAAMIFVVFCFFAGTINLFYWNQLLFLLHRRRLRAANRLPELHPANFFATSGINFCWNQHERLLRPSAWRSYHQGKKNATTGASNCYGRHFYLLEPVKSRRGGASSSDIICYIRHQFLLEPARVPDGHTTPLELLPRAARMLQPATEVVMTTPATLRRHTMLGDGDVFVLHRTQQGLLATTATC